MLSSIKSIFFLLILSSKINADTPLLSLQLVQAARDQVGETLTYDPSYVKLDYPLGDIPRDRGVCTDVIIRAFRVFDVDLQKEVSESISNHYTTYKKHLTNGRKDTNIDHRRVKVLASYFKLQGFDQKTTIYEAGDILVFDLGRGIWHIAIVSDRFSEDKKRPLVIHNICCGAKEDDIGDQFPVLFCFRINATFLTKD
ncbi:MAG: DUF1287 domain-containing protein [Alphaproteobacteria bacterium]|nr:DUF1287 domain-containing protein [Alphaproteobacteria bacterium]